VHSDSQLDCGDRRVVHLLQSVMANENDNSQQRRHSSPEIALLMREINDSRKMYVGQVVARKHLVPMIGLGLRVTSTTRLTVWMQTITEPFDMPNNDATKPSNRPKIGVASDLPLLTFGWLS
jgi:hypothetical protein